MDYSTLSPEQIKAEMDKRYVSGQPYTLQIKWDIERMHDLNAKTLQLIGDIKGKRILEVCCGQGGTAAYLPPDTDFTGVELSSEAVALAQRSFPEFTFLQGDASDLDMAECAFDVVIAKEAIEHLLDQPAAVAEWYRVLKPGGCLVLTTPNRDSLHLRMNRLLGGADFKCSYDHTHELTFNECVGLLGNAGFAVTEKRGSFLMPYWGVNGVDHRVRPLTDNNADCIAIFKALGDAVPPEYSFCMVLKAVKA